MLVRRVYRLCIFDPTTIVFKVTGAMPRFALSIAYATIYRMGEDGYLWRYETEFGVDDEGEMVPIDETINHTFIDHEVDIAFEIDLPEDTSTSPGSLTFRVNTPTFEVSPIFAGRDIRCIQTIEPPRLRIRDFDIFAVPDEQLAARLIAALYEDVDAAKALLIAVGIRPENISSRAADLTADGGVIACRDENVLFVAKIGTTTSGQLITQGDQLMAGPFPFAGIGTAHIWGSAAISMGIVLNQLDTSGITRVVLTGHSLGGAACSVLAGLLLQSLPALQIDVLTFGSPKPGDKALVETLLKTGSCRIENDDDPVPYMAPTEQNLNGFAAVFLGPTIVANLGKWKHPRGRYVLWNDGSRSAGDPVQPDIDVIGDLLVSWFNGDPGPNLPAHDMAEYVRRLDLA